MRKPSKDMGALLLGCAAGASLAFTGADWWKGVIVGILVWMGILGLVSPPPEF